MKAKILNINNFHSTKKNQDYSIITVLRDITQNERNRGIIGNLIAEELFLPEQLVNKFNASHIDKECEVVYDVIGGKAVLSDVIVK